MTILKKEIRIDKEKDTCKVELTLDDISLTAAIVETVLEEIDSQLKLLARIKNRRKVSKAELLNYKMRLTELKEKLENAALGAIGDKLMEALKADEEKK